MSRYLPDVRLGQGAFLSLRLSIYSLPTRAAESRRVSATSGRDRALLRRALRRGDRKASHLSCIVRAAGEAHRDGDLQLLGPALFAYALYLEQESHFDEAKTPC